MDNMYEHIAALCKLKGVSVTQMCRDLGITRSVLTELKNGRTQRLSIKYTKLILEYFNIDMTVFERPVEEIGLLTENDNKKSPSELDELLNDPLNKELWNQLSKMSRAKKTALLALIQDQESN